MELRFKRAMLAAAGLHAAVLGWLAWRGDRAQAPGLDAASNWTSVDLTIGDDSSSNAADSSAAARANEGRGSATPDTARKPSAVRSLSPRQHPRALRSTPAPSLAGAGDAGGISSAGLGQADAGETAPQPTSARKRKLDLGLDGQILASAAARSLAERPPAAQQAPAIDSWSEALVHAVAERGAPDQGSALFTIEWDASGRLRLLSSSAHSSDDEAWQRLAEKLRQRLAQRPQRPANGRGLRLVYLIRSETVSPGKRSDLPESRHASLQRLEAPDHANSSDLPPGNAIMFGVKADLGPAARRVISLTLTRSQLL